ncbi:hypothetical protein GALMADRAFT_152956 [Galerina marginata CBS 339.88]|uniref:Uncharacterized protein n=1 Tax=Galerina marginata (strain CBS 339.88) TaxID=685588 RepID=A0A067TG81_GALM3|nr:hypothetical protein GALMADRAFT_152956 [Galerina marginata CBS 339.88]
MLLCCSPKGSLGPCLSHPEYLTDPHQLFCTYFVGACPLVGEYLDFGSTLHSLLDHHLDSDLDPAPSSGSMASQISTSSCVNGESGHITTPSAVLISLLTTPHLTPVNVGVPFPNYLLPSLLFFPTGGRMEWVHKSWMECRGRPGASFVVIGFLFAIFIHVRMSCSKILSSSLASSAFHESF